MATATVENLSSLYEADETAWLEAMAELIRDQRLDELDYANLREYLTDMANRDRREVNSRLTVLIAHVLKWFFQPDKRTKGWRLSFVVQSQEVADLVAGGVLRSQAQAVLPEVYKNAVDRASIETGLPESAFPAECPYDLDQLTSPSLLDN